MKFKLDENLPEQIAFDIRAAGHEADTVVDEGLAGTPDAALMARVQSEGRVFLTMDKGIGNIRVYPPQDYSGIVLLRLPSADRAEIIDFFRTHLPALLRISVNGKLVVVNQNGIRSR